MAVIFDPLNSYRDINSYRDSKKGSNEAFGRAERWKALEILPSRGFLVSGMNL